jgi:hypothetical protein
MIPRRWQIQKTLGEAEDTGGAAQEGVDTDEDK